MHPARGGQPETLRLRRLHQVITLSWFDLIGMLSRKKLLNRPRGQSLPSPLEHSMVYPVVSARRRLIASAMKTRDSA